MACTRMINYQNLWTLNFTLTAISQKSLSTALRHDKNNDKNVFETEFLDNEFILFYYIGLIDCMHSYIMLSILILLAQMKYLNNGDIISILETVFINRVIFLITAQIRRRTVK